MSLLICIHFNIIMALILLHLVMVPRCFLFPHKHSNLNNKLTTSCPISRWEQADLLKSVSSLIIMPFFLLWLWVYRWHVLQRLSTSKLIWCYLMFYFAQGMTSQTWQAFNNNNICLYFWTHVEIKLFLT